MPLFFLWFHKSQGGMSSNPSVITTYLPSLGTHPQKGSSSSGFMWKHNRRPVVSSATLRGMSSVLVPTAMSGRVVTSFPYGLSLRLLSLKQKGTKHTQLNLQNQFWWCVVYVGSRRGVPTGPKWWGRGNRKWVSSVFPHGENTSDPLWVLSLFGMPCVLQSVFSAYIP